MNAVSTTPGSTYVTAMPSARARAANDAAERVAAFDGGYAPRPPTGMRATPLPSMNTCPRDSRSSGSASRTSATGPMTCVPNCARSASSVCCGERRRPRPGPRCSRARRCRRTSRARARRSLARSRDRHVEHRGDDAPPRRCARASASSAAAFAADRDDVVARARRAQRQRAADPDDAPVTTMVLTGLLRRAHRRAALGPADEEVHVAAHADEAVAPSRRSGAPRGARARGCRRTCRRPSGARDASTSSHVRRVVLPHVGPRLPPEKASRWGRRTRRRCRRPRGSPRRSRRLARSRPARARGSCRSRAGCTSRSVSNARFARTPPRLRSPSGGKRASRTTRRASSAVLTTGTMMPQPPRSSTRWICELSFHAARTIGALAAADRGDHRARFGERDRPCSMSISSQSQPWLASSPATSGSEIQAHVTAAAVAPSLQTASEPVLTHRAVQPACGGASVVRRPAVPARPCDAPNEQPRATVRPCTSASRGRQSSACSRSLFAARARLAAASRARRARRRHRVRGGAGGYGPGRRRNRQRAANAATAAYHVETSFRGSRLELARGSETITPHGTAGEGPTSVRWTLTPL